MDNIFANNFIADHTQNIIIQLSLVAVVNECKFNYFFRRIFQNICLFILKMLLKEKCFLYLFLFTLNPNPYSSIKFKVIKFSIEILVLFLSMNLEAGVYSAYKYHLYIIPVLTKEIPVLRKMKTGMI